MFEGLSDKLERSFKILKGHGHITEINVAETLKEVRKALLSSLTNPLNPDTAQLYPAGKLYKSAFSVSVPGLYEEVFKRTSPDGGATKVYHNVSS